MNKDIYDDNEECLPPTPTRHEALRICFGNIMEGKPFNSVSTFIVMEGLLNILFSEDPKTAIESFGVTPPFTMESLYAPKPKNPVGRPPDPPEVKKYKEENKKLREIFVYLQVERVLVSLNQKRSSDATKVSLSVAFRAVAKSRDEPEGSISSWYYAGKKRMESLQ